MTEAAAPPDEFALIARWLSHFDAPDTATMIPPGDDAAAVRPTPGHLLLATTDALVEDVHFRRKTWPAAALGHRALAVNLSDLAAMGARPRWALLALGLPGDVGTDWLDRVATGMAKGCREAGVSLVGGNVTGAAQVSFTLTLLGEARPDRVLRRSGARPGDVVFVSGTLGDAALGLESLKARRAMPRKLTDLERRHCRPTARVRLGCALAEARVASAAIDVSDGFIADLRHLLDASRVGAEIRLPDLPLSPAYRRATLGREDPLGPALYGGEDYELVFTAPQKRAAKIAEVARGARTAVRAVGRVIGEAGVHLVGADGRRVLAREAGFKHR
jgi:thiamine-monophosphate kinase